MKSKLLIANLIIWPIILIIYLVTPISVNNTQQGTGGIKKVLSSILILASKEANFFTDLLNSKGFRLFNTFQACIQRYPIRVVY